VHISAKKSNLNIMTTTTNY